MIKIRSIILLSALGFAFPLISANATDGDEHLWNIRIQSTEDGSGKFSFDASLKRSSGAAGKSSQDELRVPRMTVAPGKEANIEIKATDREPTVTARVSIDESGMKVEYSLMIRTEDGVHSSSADLDLSASKTRDGTE